MAIAHEGLASLAVYLHEVGDLLALTNSLVQLHNLDGGSQMTPNQSRRHHSPKGNRWCVDDEHYRGRTTSRGEVFLGWCGVWMNFASLFYYGG